MKIVLLKDVPGVGRKCEVKTVADGYAVNFLIPRKLAEAGTAAAVARVEQMKKATETEHQIQANLLEKNFDSLNGAVIAISQKANEKGHLFSGIHKETIAAELKKQKGIDVLPEFIELAHPIKSVGENQISVKFKNKTVSFTLIVIALGST